jgi:flagellar hook-length control protein FliK
MTGSSAIEGTSTVTPVAGMTATTVGRDASSGFTFSDNDGSRDDGGDGADEDGTPGHFPANGANNAPLQPTARHLTETAKSTASDPAPVVDRAHLVQQVSKHIETMRAAARTGEMSLRLNPEHLGSMQLTVVSHGNGVSARIAVETAAAYRACDEAKDQLRAALESRGLEVTSLNISLSQQTSGDASPNRQNQGAEQPFNYNATRRSVRAPDIIASGPDAKPARIQRNGDGRLDYHA